MFYILCILSKVGYGDKIPKTDGGRTVACLCALFGVLIFGLPIPVLVKSFHKFYDVVNVKAAEKSRQGRIGLKNLRKSSSVPELDEKDQMSEPLSYDLLENRKRKENDLNVPMAGFNVPRLVRRRTKGALLEHRDNADFQ